MTPPQDILASLMAEGLVGQALLSAFSEAMTIVNTDLPEVDRSKAARALFNELMASGLSKDMASAAYTRIMGDGGGPLWQ